MPDSIDIHRVEMWDHETEVVNCHRDYPPYERITITIHTEGKRQTIITLYQEVKCELCGEEFTNRGWTDYADKFAHQECVDEHTSDMDDWIDRYAARNNDRWETTDHVEEHNPRPEGPEGIFHNDH